MGDSTILVVGDLSVDLTVRVSALPESDQKVTGHKESLSAGGMGANVAVGLARLGSKARLISVVGRDHYGQLALENMRNQGVDLRWTSELSDADTFLCIIMLGADGEKALVRLPTEAYLPSAESLEDNAFIDVSHVHLTLGDATLTQHAIAKAKQQSATTSLDLEEADILDDRETITSILNNIDFLFLNSRAQTSLREKLGLGKIDGSAAVITTLGAAGSVYEESGETFRAAGYPVKAKDTTGAGDAFAAAFLHARLTLKLDPHPALEFANAAAALSTQHYGAQVGLPNSQAISSFMKKPTR